MSNTVYYHRLVKDESFIEVFWEEYRSALRLNPRTTQEDVFDKLNDEYFSVFGVYRFKSFDAFRKMRDRKRVK